MTEHIISLIGDVLKIVIPASLAVYGMYITIRSYSTREMEKMLLDYKQKSDGPNLTLKLQAHERWVLFLERMALQNLFVRENNPGYNVALWRQHLMNTINEEYMHNASSQVYISEMALALIKDAIQKTQSMINEAADALNGDEPCVQLASRVFENLIANNGEDPTLLALAQLRADVRVLIEG